MTTWLRISQGLSVIAVVTDGSGWYRLALSLEKVNTIGVTRRTVNQVMKKWQDLRWRTKRNSQRSTDMQQKQEYHT
ncbi:hypothetical protein EOD39_2971 [Acipenser ruthenus]|uniref:Myb/SANT-like DNA-binding domain-containing protein n=1 Tax=Acipenser ruthenus TaxID=7906 RepID=A0A444TX53_ACIRT|nr:hypothetical protein EOD39_2971 [Acipenser ruthenus]